MAILVRSTIASVEPNTAKFICKGESGSTIAAVSPCFMNTDGKIYAAAITSGSGADGRAKYLGFSAQAVQTGEIVDLYRGTFEYATGMTAGTLLYITSGSPGYLETVAPTTTVGTAASGSVVIALNDPVAMALDAKRIVVF